MRRKKERLERQRREAHQRREAQPYIRLPIRRESAASIGGCAKGVPGSSCSYPAEFLRCDVRCDADGVLYG